MAEPEQTAKAPPYSFATNLLGCFDVVKGKNQATIKTCEELSYLFKGRASAEMEYSKALQRLATQAEAMTKSCEEGSTLKEGLEALRSDLANKSVQHNIFSTCLLAEVHDPLVQVKNQLVLQSKEPVERANQMNKTMRALDNKYRQSHVKFEKAYQAALASSSLILEHGGTPPKVDPHQVYKKYGLDAVLRNSTSPTGLMRSKKKESASTSTGPTNILGITSKADLTSWLLPTERERKEETVNTCRNQLEFAELCRYSCRDHYDAMWLYAHECTHNLQLILTEYQMLEERCIDELKVLLRKDVVFESSCLANEQYDVQMVFKVLETIDKDVDLAAFIAKNDTYFPGVDISALLKSLSININNPLPFPPPGLTMDTQSCPLAPPDNVRWPIVRPETIPEESAVASATSVLQMLLVNSKSPNVSPISSPSGGSPQNQGTQYQDITLDVSVDEDVGLEKTCIVLEGKGISIVVEEERPMSEEKEPET